MSLSLLPPEFGLRAGDPLVPDITQHWVRAGRNNLETAAWCSGMPLTHAIGLCPMKLEWRIEAVQEHATNEGHIAPPWTFTLEPTSKTLIAKVRRTGPTGWWNALPPYECHAVEACAQGHTQVIWMFLHATAELHSGESLVGVLWMLTGGISWDKAIMRARKEEVTS